MRVQRTRLRSPLTRHPLGRGSRISVQCLIVSWLAIGCTTASALKEPPTWRIELWGRQDQYLGAVVVQLTGHRAHGAPDSPARWVEIGRVLEHPSGVEGVGQEAEVRIDGSQFEIDLNRGAVDNNLEVSGKVSGAVASGEAWFKGVAGLKVGRFTARRV